MPYSISDINQMSQSAFVAAFGAVFEETPEIAAQAWQARPFLSASALHKAMVAVVNSWTPTEQLRLIAAHPDLGSRVQMAAASVQEQSGAGLGQLSADEYARFQRLNDAYKEKFGFPFVMAVKGCDKETILQAFETRQQNDISQEREKSLSEIFRIARFRLDDLVEAE